MGKAGILENVDVVRREGKQVHVLGHNPGRFQFDEGSGTYLAQIVHDATTGEVISEDYFKRKNDNDIMLAIPFSMVGIGIPFFINELRPSVRRRARETNQYYKDVKRFQEANVADLREAVKDIRVYQGTLEEVSRDIGIPLERVETGKPETFVRADDTFWLRVRALERGADAIVHYQPGSSVGTPVRYVEQTQANEEGS